MLSDESEGDMDIEFDADASNHLSCHRMEYYRDRNHPRKVIKDAKGDLKHKKWPICGTNTGRLSCFERKRRSDLSKYGSGVTVYFMFLKLQTSIFLFLTLLSLPSMVFYYYGS